MEKTVRWQFHFFWLVVHQKCINLTFDICFVGQRVQVASHNNTENIERQAELSIEWWLWMKLVGLSPKLFLNGEGGWTRIVVKNWKCTSTRVMYSCLSIYLSADELSMSSTPHIGLSLWQTFNRWGRIFFAFNCWRRETLWPLIVRGSNHFKFWDHQWQTSSAFIIIVHPTFE